MTIGLDANLYRSGANTLEQIAILELLVILMLMEILFLEIQILIRFPSWEG